MRLSSFTCEQKDGHSDDCPRGPIKALKFGDVVVNHWAGMSNPHRIGVFVKFTTIRKSKCMELTDMKGDFWHHDHSSRSRCERLGSVFSEPNP